jgi:activator of 2-hydroxyglutaryl-CoA dehydratase
MERILEKSMGPIDGILATGYGKVSFSADEVVSDITVHAKGSNIPFPNPGRSFILAARIAKSSA